MSAITRLLISTILFFFAYVQAQVDEGIDVLGTLKRNEVLNDFGSLSPNSKVTLDGGLYSTSVRYDGSFILYNVKPGSYLLDVTSTGYAFPKIRLDVSTRSVKAFYSVVGNPWSFTGASLDYPPLEIAAAAREVIFMPREGFNVASLFKNPMMLMMGVSVIFLFIMPKLAKSIDPDMLKEMQEGMSGAAPQVEGAPGRKKEQPPKVENPFEGLDVSRSLANMFAGPSQQPASGSKKK